MEDTRCIHLFLFSTISANTRGHVIGSSYLIDHCRHVELLSGIPFISIFRSVRTIYKSKLRPIEAQVWLNILHLWTFLVIITPLNWNVLLHHSSQCFFVVIIPQNRCNHFAKFEYFRFTQLMCFLLSPLMVVYWIVLALTWWSFGELSVLALIKRALFASMDALTFSIVDSIVSINEGIIHVFPCVIQFFYFVSTDLQQLVVSIGRVHILSHLDNHFRHSHLKGLYQNQRKIKLK